MKRFDVIEKKVWLRDDGKRASVFGAVPWTTQAEKDRWAMVSDGWTIRDNLLGTVGGYATTDKTPRPDFDTVKALADNLEIVSKRASA